MKRPISFLDHLPAVATLVAIAAVVVLVVAAVAGFAGFAEQRGESTYSGVVVDFENERGFVFKTTQAHLKTNPESSSGETFCVHPENRDRQVEVLREAARDGSVVTVTYSRPYFVPPWECESGISIIRDVEIREDVSPEEISQ